jgi:choline dehydrogenase-like flavoprotein
MERNFVDARTDPIEETVDAAVCLVGAGAAGITLARALAPSIPGVVLIESGGFEPEGETQNLYSGLNLGLPFPNLAACRMRYFGGTTNAWYGHSRENDAIDYEGRPEIGLPKWPITQSELHPYYAKALETLGNSPRSLDTNYLVSTAGFPTDDLVERRSDALMTKVFQTARNLRFAAAFREELENLANLTVYLHLNAMHVQLSADGGRVEHIDGATLSGRNVRVRAKIFVICCGAIENARLLLASNDVMTAGIGNGSDHVGRYLMDHIHFRASRFIPGPAFPSLYDRAVSGRKDLLIEIGLKDDYVRRSRISQYYCEMDPFFEDDEVRLAVADFRGNFMKPGGRQFISDIATILSDLGGSRRYLLARRRDYLRPDYFVMDHRIEQTPNWDSRVVLSDRRDVLGSPVADVDWQLSETEYRTFEVGQETLARELSALGLGRVQLEPITPEMVRERPMSHFHQMGTTRMSAEPGAGVVDTSCRVHGVANLYIGGSSVLPSAGYGNPTMTLIAFALRLADHIKLTVGA